MLSENGDVIQIDTTGRAHSTVSIQNGGQTVPCGFPLDRNDFQSYDALASAFNQHHQRIENGANFPGRYIVMRMRRVYLSMRTEGIKAFSNGYGVVV